jgi:glycosyl hydrolase family 15
MPLVFFVSPTDPRVLKTLQQINRSPGKGGLVCNSLVHRYNVELTPDGLKGEDATFYMCTFWLVEALTRAGKVTHRVEEARRGPWEFSAGVYASGLNQRRIQSEPSARRRLGYSPHVALRFQPIRNSIVRAEVLE